MDRQYNPENSQSSDPFWEKAESLYLQALFYYVWLECPKSEQNFSTVLKLLGEAEVRDDGSAIGLRPQDKAPGA